MHVFKSKNSSLHIPDDIPVWSWLFDSASSPLETFPRDEIRGYTNTVTKEHLSYWDVKIHTTHLSTVLSRDFGFKKGETAALFSPNTVWYPVAMLGILRAGGVVCGASPAYNVEEMSYALRTIQAKYLFTVPASMRVAAAAANAVGIPQERIFLLEGDMDGYTTMKDLLNSGASYGEFGQIQSYQLPPGKKNTQVCGFLCFSSGTTGLPKAVMISHSNVIAQCLQVRHVSPATSRGVLAVLPLFHITGLVHQLHLPILRNANVYMLPSFSMDSMCQAVQEYRLEELLLVPPILIRMVREPDIVHKYDLSSVKRFSSGAAPMSPEILELLRTLFPGTGFKQGYGMTESCSCITLHPPEYYDYKYAFQVGTLVSNTEVKIIDPDTGTNCGFNQPGEIWARGPQITMGYLNNKQATEEAFDSDGFLHTGDIGTIDHEGLITITDRLKEMIKVKGIGVAPAEIEDLLLGHPSVEDVAVLGIKDEYSGERPKAYVVLKQNQEKGKAVGRALINYVREKKVRHKWVREIELVDDIPKSASGKILRRVLRDRAKGKSMGIVVRDEGRLTRL